MQENKKSSKFLELITNGKAIETLKNLEQRYKNKEKLSSRELGILNSLRKWHSKQGKNGMTDFQAMLAEGKAMETLTALEERYINGKTLSQKEQKLLESLQTWRSKTQEKHDRKIFFPKETKGIVRENPVEKAIRRNHRKKYPQKRLKPIIRRF